MPMLTQMQPFIHLLPNVISVVLIHLCIYCADKKYNLNPLFARNRVHIYLLVKVVKKFVTFCAHNVVKSH